LRATPQVLTIRKFISQPPLRQLPKLANIFRLFAWEFPFSPSLNFFRSAKLGGVLICEYGRARDKVRNGAKSCGSSGSDSRQGGFIATDGKIKKSPLICVHLIDYLWR
jgi:hypothetical protein